MKNIEDIISHTSKLTLLYVEDNIDAREAILLLLEDIFEDIIVAANGQDGLDKFQNNKIDLILTDINMPIMDGLEMSKEIKKIDDDMPIIILTALTELSTLKKAIDIGIDSFINKPFTNIDILFDKLSNIVKKIEYDKTKQEEEQIKIDKEKIQLVFNMIKNISHHWQQPLSVITTITSTLSFKIEHDMPITSKDLGNIETVTTKTKELSDILYKLERLDFNNITLKEIEDMISISNPLYEK
jgi:CheY-like chemotaxis protein